MREVLADSSFKENYLYHVTPTRLLSTILAEGLKPSTGIATSGFQTQGRIFLAAYQDDIRELLGEMQSRDLAKEPFALLEIRLPTSITLYEDLDTFGSDAFFYVKRRIPSEYIEVISKQVVARPPY